MKIKLNYKYLFAFLVIFAIILFIAIFVTNYFVRAFLGDVIIVILIYTFIKSFVRNEIKLLPLYIFIFATLVEIGQYFHFLDRLWLGEYELIRIIIGVTFDIWDIVCYFVGCAIIWVYEIYLRKERS